MSGPLASWVLAHTKAAHPAERFVLAALALRCNHDGVGVATVEQLEDATGHNDRTVRAALLAAIKREELERPKRGAAGYPSRYRFVARRCVEPGDCHTCATLDKVLETGSQARFRGDKRQPKTGSQRPKTGSERPKTGSETRPNGNGDGPPLKGEPSPPGESNERGPRPPSDGAGGPARLDLEDLAARCPTSFDDHRYTHEEWGWQRPGCPWCATHPTAEQFRWAEGNERVLRSIRDGLADDEEGQG